MVFSFDDHCATREVRCYGQQRRLEKVDPRYHMIVRTCLLISDDPDDHVEFSEALYEVSDDAVLIAVSDVQKALDLLKHKKCLPEFIFLYMDIPAFEPDIFFEALQEDEQLTKVKVIAYGNQEQVTHSPLITMFLSSDMNYSELKDALRRIL